MRSNSILLSSFCGLSALTASSTFAAVTATSNSAAFDSSITLATPLVTFAGLPDVSYTAAEADAGIDFGFFSVKSDVLSDFDGDVEISSEQLGLFPDNLFGGSPSFTLTLDSPVTSFGADFTNVSTAGLPFTLGSDPTNTNAASLGGGSFFGGFTSTIPFTTITFGPTFDFFTLDNIRFGNVPEPTTLAALAGLALIGLRRR